MKIYQNWEEVTGKHENVTVALGNFDGVHIGHRYLIESMAAKARDIGGTSLIFTFYPHPAAVLSPEKAPPSLLNQDGKQRIISGLGVDVMVNAQFTREFARMSPGDFVKQVLVDSLQARWIFVGYNYNFGYKGQGTPDLLKELGARYGVNVQVLPPVKVDGQVVSSTLIRHLLQDGEVDRARRFLGYHPYVEGEVVRGEERGKQLGFPTANLEIDNRLIVPASGVYSVKVKVGEDEFVGVANVGVKPTFHGNNNKKKNLEVHLLDFGDELYGRNIKVYFTRRLRGEKRFSSVSELVRQIEQDVCKARAEME